MDRITLRRPDDWHLHLRREKILSDVLGFTIRQFSRVLIMPNTRPRPILTAFDAQIYKEEILLAAKRWPKRVFVPYMTIQITPNTTPHNIKEASEVGVLAGKLYPEGVTTNSENGVTDFRALYPVFEQMQACNMVLSIHGESPDETVPGLEKEKAFLETLHQIVFDFPGLRIVLEHITTRAAVDRVLIYPRTVAATITVHHLLLTLDDVIGYGKESGGKMQPHHFCKPIAKTKADREALIEAATMGSPKFFYGGDSAPHLRETKECSFCCAGVFNAPVALPLLVQLFEERDAFLELEQFTSVFGAAFYGVYQNEGTISLERENWKVPPSYNGIVPFMAGKTLPWRVIDQERR